MGDFSENKIRHLEMIEGVITRMGSNSFALKGWTVTLVAGIFALANKDADKMYFIITYVPIIIFWFLDSFYLQLERRYRALFDIAKSNNNDDIDFNMKAPKPTTDKKLYYCDCLMSLTEFWFYIPCAFLVALVIFLGK